ncbi:hypothetical protein K458DRAFT_317242 [Lentithecium fluviatile CBS 122367]|uniref:Uncharacterized protein n=1 Tax=Lentithecium fluviatile CBS 122367 TaxID=1168545 RepID=A0A6G1IK68_9PLEO|nr:hypothetical protein K458DRAFT_317242 [Lentithecium fluviatile CBS 122367]
MAVADVSAEPDASYDEAQNISALAHLERLQAQLNGLRPTVSRVVTPFYSPPSPALFHEFKAGLYAAQAEIKSFRNNFLAQETQAILEHARQRESEDGDLSKCGEVSHYGWIEREKREKENAKKTKGAETVEQCEAALTDEEVDKIVREWRARNLKLGFEAKERSRDLTIIFVAYGYRLRFHVVVSQDANEPRKLQAACMGTTDVDLTITRCIASRPNVNDLKYLLDMIAAYKNVKSADCAKCGKVYDTDLYRPWARRGKHIDAVDEKAEIVWQALHESCLD